MASGEIDVVPGRVLAPGELITHDKLNDLGTPILRLKASGVTAREIADGSISSDKLDVDLEAQLGVADGSVTTAKIVDLAVTTAKIADDAVTAAKLSAGMIAQVRYNSSATELEIDAEIPNDDTIPQISEGMEILSHTITPAFTTSQVLIRAIIPWRYNSTCDSITFAIFRGAGPSAIVGIRGRAGDEEGGIAVIEFLDTPATTSAVTYSVRGGCDDENNWFITNAGSSGIGGVSRCTLSLLEILQ